MRPIIKKYGSGKPTIAIVGSLHGDEPVGAKIIKELAKCDFLSNKAIITIIGNPGALKKKARFIDEDLNRLFSQKKNNTQEGRIAYIIKKELKGIKVVIDIHSTTTNTKDTVIVTKLNKNIREIINIIKPKNVVKVTSEMSRGSLIGNVECGLSLEYGRHDSKKTFDNSFKDIVRFLSYKNIISHKLISEKKVKINYYEIYGKELKPENFNMRSINNLSLVRKGKILGSVDNKLIRAKDSFYPFLFGPNAYPDIMGFKTKKL